MPSSSSRPRVIGRRPLTSASDGRPTSTPTSPGWMEAAWKAVPGLALSWGVARGGFVVADAVAQTTGVPVSGVPVAILLGAALNNAPGGGIVPAWCRPGITLASSALLRLGIVCVGCKLSALEVAAAGAVSVPAALTSVGVGLVVIPRLAAAAQLPPRLGSLLAVGTSICGVTAISALAPAIAATQAEMGVAVASVVMFGTAGMLLLPHVAHALLGHCGEAAGMFLGLAVHDTAQVMGAALTYQQRHGDELAFQAAVVTKLTRNLLLAFAVPALTAAHAAGGAAARGGGGMFGNVPNPVSLAAQIPTFLVAFLGMSLLRSIGDAALASRASAVEVALHRTSGTDARADGDDATEQGAASPRGSGGSVDGADADGWLGWMGMDQAGWKRLVRLVGDEVGAKQCLGTAMAAVGLSISTAVVRGVGFKPFAVGAAGSAVVGGMGLTTAAALAVALPVVRGGEGSDGGVDSNAAAWEN